MYPLQGSKLRKKCYQFENFSRKSEKRDFFLYRANGDLVAILRLDEKCSRFCDRYGRNFEACFVCH